MKKYFFAVFCLTIFLLIGTSVYAGSNLIAMNAIHKLHETYIVLKFDKLPVYKSEVVNGGGTLGKDFVDGKTVQSQNNVNETSLDLTFYDSVNKTGKTEVKLPKSTAQIITVNEKQGHLDADIHLGKYLANFVWSEGNSVIVTINNDNSDYEKKLGRYSNFYIKNVKLNDGKTTWVYILEINNSDNFVFEPVLGGNTKEALSTVSNMLWKQDKGFAAVNSCYFGRGGLLYSIFKKSGDIQSTGPYHRTALGIKNKNEFNIETTDFKAEFTVDGKNPVNIETINRLGGEKVAMFTPVFWDSKTNTKSNFIDFTVIDGKVKKINSEGNSDIPEDGFVLSISKELSTITNSIKINDKIDINMSLGKVFKNYPDVMEVGPCLVKDGEINVTSEIEHFQPDIAVGRAPRTAFGYTADGKVYIIVVDGRREDSVGMSLDELAAYMKNELNVKNAMNFDGGGSSEMVIDKAIVNRPTDGHERKVGAAFLVLNK